jgi:peptide/nickel transport system substrate-binding protein
MRKIYWYISAYSRKHGWVVLASVIVAIVIFSFTIPIIARFLDLRPRQYIGLVGTHTLSSLPSEVQNRLSLGLTTVNEDGTVAPSLSERWTVENDEVTYRFVLRKNIVWQDGKPLEPGDIHYSFSNVETITTPNDVVFKLNDVFVPFPSVVSEPVFRSDAQRYLFFFSRPTVIGLGEYRLADYKRRGDRITQVSLEGTDDWLIYRFYQTEEEAITAFKRGEVDVLPDITNLRDLKEWPSIETSSKLHTDRYLAVFFNVPLFEKNTRLALSYATIKPTDHTRAIGPLNPKSWAYLEGGKSYDYDLERAKERLLDSIPGQPMVIELATTPTFESEAEAIKQQWEELGIQAAEACHASKDIKEKGGCDNLKIQVNLRISTYPDTANFQTLLIGQEIPSDPDQYYLWHSDVSTNFTNYKNTRIDSLLERGRQTSDRNERLAIYQEFQQFFLEDAPAIFIRYIESHQVKRK